MRSGFLVLLTALSLLLSGCAAPHSPGGSLYSNYRDIEDMQLVRTMGFDTAAGGLRLTVSSAQGPRQSPTALLSAEGAGIVRAAGRLQDWSAQEELFFAHAQFVLVGEEMAREGIAGILDYMERDARTRLDLPVFIVKGGTAAELIAGAGSGEYEITEVLASLRREAEKQGSAYCFSLMEIARRLSRSGAALCCAVEPASLGGNALSAEAGTITAREVGYAVVRDGVLTGFLDREASQGVNLLLDRAGTESLALAQDGIVFTLTLEEGKADILPRWNSRGELELLVQMEYQAGVSEISRPEDLRPGTLEALEALFSRWLTGRVNAALEAARELDADFLEIGRLAQRTDPLAFAAADWEGFPASVTWQIEARGAIERSYELQGAADTRGEGRDHV